MKRIKVSLISIIAVVLVFTFVENAKAQSSCMKLFIEDQNSTAGRSLVYSPIFSSDQGLLSTFKFAEGPSPQRNMSIPTEPKDQYIIGKGAAEIFKQKQRLTNLNRTKVIQYLEGYGPAVLAAAREQFDRMLIEFAVFYPEVYEVKNQTLINKITGDRVSRNRVQNVTDPNAAIELVGKLMQEDLIFMKKDSVTGDYILIGGYLVFPTHWSLDRAIGWTLTQIHNNIPGTPESRAQFVKMISMVLDRSLAAPERIVIRNNWFIESDPRYAIPSYIRTQSPVESKIAEILASGENTELLKELVSLRIERQSIRGLPYSGVVLFTINPNVFQLKTVLQNPSVVATLRQGLELKFPDTTADELTKIVKKILNSAIEKADDQEMMN
jgi:hypothetical protein